MSAVKTRGRPKCVRMVANESTASDALALDFLAQLADAIVDPVDERVKVFGLAISVERTVLVVEFLEDLPELGECDEMLGLQREDFPERVDRILEVVLFGGESCAAVPAL